MAYLLIPLDEAIVFPTVTATLPIDVGDEDRVFLLPRSDGEFARVGVVAVLDDTSATARATRGLSDRTACRRRPERR